MLGASVVAQLVRLVELLTTGAIEATIGALVDITALEASGPKAFDAGPASREYKEIVDLMATVLKTDAAGLGPLPAGLAVDLKVPDLENQAKFFQSVGYIEKVPATTLYVNTKFLNDSKL